ncbi:MAG: CRTAC1 family protein [Gammaproteobacteria bacterium]|nr:CRTAC1 family protein [Gammaproteobacteria bacterium]
MIISKRVRKTRASAITRRMREASNSAVSVLLITIALTVLPQAAALATVWECTHGANLDSVPWVSDPSKGQQTNPIRQKVIFVSFNSSENAGSEYASDRQAMLDACAGMFDRESRGSHRISYEIVGVPGQPGAMWLLSPESASDFATSGDFGSAARVDLFHRFRSSWIALGAYQGELQCRVMELIKRAYDVEYGAGNWTSPLADADAVLIAIAPDIGGNVQNPLYRNGTTLGVPRLSIRTNTNDPRIAAVVNAAPSIGSDNAILGTVVLLGPTHSRRNVAVASHLWGHVLGMDDIVNPRPSGVFPGSAGGYSVMRYWLDFAESAYLPFEQFDHPTRVQAGWIAPVPVLGNVRGAVIAPCKSNGAVYRIPVAYSSWTEFDEIGDPYWKSTLDEYFIVAYEDGQHPEYSAADTGLYIWHCLDYSRTCQTYRPPLCRGSNVLIRFRNRDLEVATGRFGDPGTWQVPDTVNGSDTLDFWDGRDYAEFFAHMGSTSDLFDHEGGEEFSYRVAAPGSANPSSFGCATSAYGLRDLIPNPPQVSRPGPIPESVPTAISVRIRDVHPEGLVVDLLVAPFADVANPNGGDVLQVDNLHRIEWNLEDVVGQPNGIIDSLDIYFSSESASDLLVASGVDATLGGYDWIPGPEHIGNACRVKIVSHNTRNALVGDDLSDADFVVLDLPAAVFTDVTSQTGISFSGTAYSSNVLRVNRVSGLTDLFISASDVPSVLKVQTRVSASGVPEFDSFDGTFAPGCRGIVVADFDNDGDDDFFLAHDTTPKLYRNHNGVFFDATANLGLASLAAGSTTACWGDYDRDGWLDLYVVRSSGNPALPEPPDYLNIAGAEHRLFRNQVGVNGGFVDVTAAAGLSGVATAGSVAASWGDLEGDGDLDLLVLNLQERPTPTPPGGIGNHLFVNQGDGTFTEEFLARFPAEIDYATAAQWVDLNYDKGLDLAVACATGGSAVYFSDGSGHYQAADRVWIPDPSAPSGDGYSGVQVFDHDLDGWLDLLWISAQASEPSRLFSCVPTGVGLALVDNTANAGLSGLQRGMGATAADFTHDGDVDLFVGTPGTADYRFYKTDARSGANALDRSYVKLRLDSPWQANNRQGIGARVMVTAGDLVQIQHVDGGSGRGGQRDRELIFGLGDHDGPVTATVLWPRGHEQFDAPLVVSNAIVGETMNVITDETMVISNLNVATVVIPGTMSFDWVFSWDTNAACDSGLDVLTIDQVGIANPCLPGWTVLTPATPGVEHEYAAKPGSGFVHRFIIRNVECNLNCSVRYSAFSASGTNQATSAQKTKRVPFCPSGF